MTDESDDIHNIFDTIINNSEMWDVINFKREGGKLTIKGIDLYGSKFTWIEDLQ